MKVKTDVEAVGTSDFWYDLFEGGYIKPENFLVDNVDIENISTAIDLIEEYKDLLLTSGLVEEI